MWWFLRVMDELGITCHVGHPARIRRRETRRQKHDRRDAALFDGTPGGGSLPLDLDAVRRTARPACAVAPWHQWVCMRTQRDERATRPCAADTESPLAAVCQSRARSAMVPRGSTAVFADTATDRSRFHDLSVTNRSASPPRVIGAATTQQPRSIIADREFVSHRFTVSAHQRRGVTIGATQFLHRHPAEKRAKRALFSPLDSRIRKQLHGTASGARSDRAFCALVSCVRSVAIEHRRVRMFFLSSIDSDARQRLIRRLRDVLERAQASRVAVLLLIRRSEIRLQKELA